MSLIVLLPPADTKLLQRTGVYVVLVVLAIWATYRRATVSSKRLRWVTIALYVHVAFLFNASYPPA